MREQGLPEKAIAALRQPDEAAIDRDLDWLARPGNRLLCLSDPDYPALLAEIKDPPPVLFVHGDPALLNQPQLAMVGTRNPTATGRETAKQFAAHLGGAGIVITSGLAAGVDTEAHRGALDGGGATIAVMGTGPDRIYPANNHRLAHRIAENGALISELPPGSPPLPEHFPRRNRIISGLALGVLVVEATVESGSLITARLATDQGREVFAIPGSIHNAQARGCHALIRQGAKLVETATDVLEELAPLAMAGVELNLADQGQDEVAAEVDKPGLDPEYRQLLSCLDGEPVPIDLLVERSGLTAEAVSSMLLILELQGLVTGAAGGLYSRR